MLSVNTEQAKVPRTTYQDTFPFLFTCWPHPLMRRGSYGLLHSYLFSPSPLPLSPVTLSPSTSVFPQSLSHMIGIDLVLINPLGYTFFYDVPTSSTSTFLLIFIDWVRACRLEKGRYRHLELFKGSMDDSSTTLTMQGVESYWMESSTWMR